MITSIELTEDHKSKLLEMCFKLFKKEIHGLTIQNNGFLNYSDTSKTVDYDDRIHWFEFCTKIGHNIFSRKQFYYKSEEFITFMKIMCLQNKMKLNHPIDYLYEEFKKLK